MSPAWTQIPVGKVLSAEGGVSIDAFGKGAYIDALRGDSLYQDSVVRVPAAGRADLEIRGRNIVAPPGRYLGSDRHTVSDRPTTRCAALDIRFLRGAFRFVPRDRRK